MRAQILATMLRIEGIETTEVIEPSDEEDGLVGLNLTVHIQVPIEGPFVGVVKIRKDETFEFFPLRNIKKGIKTLVADIRQALLKSV